MSQASLIKVHNKEFCDIAKLMIKTKTDATKRYGAKYWNSLGQKGLFADINRKYIRLRNFIWEGNQQPSSENIEDTCLDMAVYSILMIMSWRLRPVKMVKVCLPPKKRKKPSSTLLKPVNRKINAK